MKTPQTTVTPFEALEALRCVTGWQRRRPTAEQIAAHAAAHPWTRELYEHVAMGLWATRGPQGISVVAVYSNGPYDYTLDPWPYGGECTLDADTEALVTGWLPLTREARPLDGFGVPAGWDLVRGPIDIRLWEDLRSLVLSARTITSHVASHMVTLGATHLSAAPSALLNLGDALADVARFSKSDPERTAARSLRRRVMRLYKAVSR
jgi:hypothetical protein